MSSMEHTHSQFQIKWLGRPLPEGNIEGIEEMVGQKYKGPGAEEQSGCKCDIRAGTSGAMWVLWTLVSTLRCMEHAVAETIPGLSQDF